MDMLIAKSSRLVVQKVIFFQGKLPRFVGSNGCQHNPTICTRSSANSLLFWRLNYVTVFGVFPHRLLAKSSYMIIHELFPKLAGLNSSEYPPNFSW
jgi:hypothetical protein